MQTPESALQLWFLWWQLTTEPIKFGQTQTKSTGELHRGILLSERMKAGDEPSYLLGFLPADSLIGWPEVLNMPEWKLIWSPYSQAIKCSSPGFWAIICLSPTALLLCPGSLLSAVPCYASLLCCNCTFFPCSNTWLKCTVSMQSFLTILFTVTSQGTNDTSVPENY